MMENSRKARAEIEAMREGGKILARIQAELVREVRDGVSTLSIDERARQLFAKARVEPSFLGYRGYPASICVSINEEIVHGIPSSRRIIRTGDLVSLDLGCIHRGLHTDTAVTVAVGGASRKAKKLLRVGRKALDVALRTVRVGVTTGELGSAIQRYVEGEGFGVVRDLIGHGVGRELHEPPAVPNFGKPEEGVKLEAGMTIAVEPMVVAGRPETETLPDGWTIVTADRSLSVHFEHTVLVTETGCEVLSKQP